jgi:hypothetical protein
VEELRYNIVIVKVKVNYVGYVTVIDK